MTTPLLNQKGKVVGTPFVLFLVLLTGGLVFWHQLPSETHSVLGEYEDAQYGIRVEIQSIKEIEKGIELLARAWKGDTQLGFGKDGSVEWERFRIYNPPILVDDSSGTIIREWVDDEGITHIRTLTEDPIRALQETLAHTINVTGKTNGNIVKGKVGTTTSTFFPDADPETNSVDGLTRRQGVDETFATIIAGAGNNRSDNSVVLLVGNIIASTTSDQYGTVARGVTLFDTASIPDGDTIDDVVLSLHVTSFIATLGDDTHDNSRIVVSDVTTQFPPTGVAIADYDQFQSTSFGESQTQTNVSTGAYEDITLNASGKVHIKKTTYTEFGFRYKWDFGASTTGLTWSSGTEMQWRAKAAETAGTSNDPKLVVVHSDATRRPQPAFKFTFREVTEITSDSAVISWDTSIPTDIQLNWSSSREEVLGQSSFRDLELNTSHSVSLSKLSPGTTYYYVIHAVAPGRGTISTGPWSFTTLPAPEDTESADETTNTEEDILAKITQQFKELQLQVIQLMRQFIQFLSEQF